MANISWLIRRLKAMSIQEVLWRLSQKRIQKLEEIHFGTDRIPVTDGVFNSKLSSLQAHTENLYINFDNQVYCLNTSIRLLSGADYVEYKKKWDAGFQTDNVWPDTFSYKLDYKQRDDIGDARTNWELNRHFQFALLAKNYVASGDEKFLNQFENLFSDWTEKNPFLHGISWTSVMEVAIRCSNWCYAYAFLEHSKAEHVLLERLRVGIINMTDYIANHYSRYSSANNHLIVEAFSVGQAGILFEYGEWIDLAIRLLTDEMPRQNYPDGINKELALHYQAFYMEAMGLMMRLMVKNGIPIPESWKLMLKKMSQYVSDCIGDYGEVIAFGDDDEGKILDLQGGEIDYYAYVLGMMSVLLDNSYTKDFKSETLRWLFSLSEMDSVENKIAYTSPQFCCYKEGGNTILRSLDHQMLIGIDHSALGFGSIAAHGHADALSFQLFYKGKAVFIDPGTYIYHCDLESRNEFRKTRVHNTVCVNGKDQSEMLGAFLWGKKANSELLSYTVDRGAVKLIVRHDGYWPILHKRTIEFDGISSIRIIDELSENAKAQAMLIISPDINFTVNEKLVRFENNIRLEVTEKIYENETLCAVQYGIKKKTKVFSIPFVKTLEMQIKI